MTDFREDDELETGADRPAKENEIGEAPGEAATEGGREASEHAEGPECTVNRTAQKPAAVPHRAAGGRGRSRARQNRKRSDGSKYGGTPISAVPENPGQNARATCGGEAPKEPPVQGKGTPEGGGGAPQLPGTSGKGRMGKKKKIALAAGVFAAAVLICAGFYFVMARQYKSVFFPNTVINGADASGKSVEQVQALIASGIDGYVLTIEARGGRTERIAGEDIGLHSVFDGSLERILAAQNPNEWLKYRFRPSEYEIDTMIAYDGELLRKTMDGLDCMNPELMEKPENARLSDYGGYPQGYTIIPEEAGTTVIPENVEKGIADAIMNLRAEFSLEESGSYVSPEITKEDEGLNRLLEAMNRCAGVAVTYQFGDRTTVLNGDRTHEWLAVNADSSVTVDAARAAEFVAELAAEYNTSNKAKTLKTSYGPTIKISGGTYGWRINQAEETALLIQNILSGESQTREPVYAQRANSFGENDYGDTYVEINLTAQHLFFYKDGVKIAESDFVSGNLSKGWGTPAGSYPLNYKERNAVLKGETYRTPVDYWMPFNGGIGMHDATWRSSFGGAIYKTGGSHGCINLPHSIAKKIYENITAGTPVLCYHLAGTEKSGTSSTKPPETTAAPTQPAEIPTQPPVETPGATQPQGPGSDTGVSPAGPAPTQPANPPAQPETQAPAGPGSDTGGGGSGPGAV